MALLRTLPFELVGRIEELVLRQEQAQTIATNRCSTKVKLLMSELECTTYPIKTYFEFMRFNRPVNMENFLGVCAKFYKYVPYNRQCLKHKHIHIKNVWCIKNVYSESLKKFRCVNSKCLTSTK